MSKTILITGSTDGIGLATAKMLAVKGHRLLLHGRNPKKLAAAVEQLHAVNGAAEVETFEADLSSIDAAATLATEVAERHAPLDVLINNAGVFSTREPTTADGLDVRFAVNTVAPYLLTRRLLPLLGATGRVVNLSSAAQASVDLRALTGEQPLADGAAYAQSKLALTLWSQSLGLQHRASGPMIVSVNPGSMLGSNMVKEAYGVAGGDIQIGAQVLCNAALDDAFAEASGQYFDNDLGQFSPAHDDARNESKVVATVAAIDAVLERLGLG